MFMWHDGFCATKDFVDAEVTITEKPKDECNLKGPLPPTIEDTSNTCVADSRTITFLSLDSSVRYYYYYLSTSDVDIVGGVWIELVDNFVTINQEGTKYLFVRGIKDNVTGMMSAPVTVCIDNNEYNVTVVPAANGTIVPSKNKAKIGEEISFTVSPSEGYRNSSITVTTTNTNITSTAKTNMLQGGITIDSTWSKVSYPVRLTSASGGQISANRSNATYGDEVIITTTPNDGYRLATLTVDGSDIKTTKKFNMPNKEIVVNATWELDSRQLTIVPNGGTWKGSTANAQQRVNIGSSITIDNPTKASSTFTGWALSNSLSTISGTTFTMGNADTTITAQFVPNSVAVISGAYLGVSNGIRNKSVTYDVTHYCRAVYSCDYNLIYPNTGSVTVTLTIGSASSSISTSSYGTTNGSINLNINSQTGAKTITVNVSGGGDALGGVTLYTSC